MIRFYVLPIETVDIYRGPKYFAWRYDPDPPGIACRWGMMDYGLIDACLVAADISQAEHDQLTANPDVAAPPQNIDQAISEAALPQVKSVLEQLRIPADWVTSAFTYRQILRMVAGLFQFAQRHHGIHNEALIDNAAQLELRWNQIPLARRERIQATADSLQYDYSAVLGTWLVRRILKHLADQWGSQPIYLGGYEI